ncbi:uncharacterized protein LOC127876667 [Dreissena polymorpha]|nr:uncharacterized protein LOC127876667 [Dreissena polymorpha]
MVGGYDEHHMTEQNATLFSDIKRTYDIRPPQAMQAIRVIGLETEYMTICEIEVYRQEDCMNGTYGPNCESRCHCLKGPCDTINGTCGSGCQAGWRGAACNETCDNGLYGRDCLTQCGYCLNNAYCNKTSGVCPGCAAGYNGSLCKDECENGSHGLRCQNMCGNCQNKVPCNKVSGVCPGECEPGYNGTMCKDACDNGWYGQSCLTQCGKCLNNTACNKTSGMCPDGCAAGYTGSLCIGVIQSELIGPAVGGSIGGIVIIAIVIVSIIAIRRRRSTPTKRHQFDDIPVAIQNGKDFKIDQTPTTSDTKPLKGPNGAILNAVYANTGSPEEDGLYYNSEPLHRKRKRTEIRLIAVDKLQEFVRDNYQNKTIFQQDFDKIPYGLQHPTIVASAATGKNRYKDMYAYDHSRVILRTIADEPNSDYINACHVDGYMEEKKYIASQGPVNPLIGDFWRMVWEQDVFIIVMATKLVEEGKMKCLKYWGESKPIIH